MARKKLFTLLALLLGVWGVVSRWSGDGPPEKPERHKDIESPRDYPVQRRDRDILQPRREHAIAWQPDGRIGRSPQGHPIEPTRDHPWEDYAPHGPANHTGGSIDQYRFRPLREREKRRMDAAYQGRYATPFFGLPDRGTAPGYPTGYNN